MAVDKQATEVLNGIIVASTPRARIEAVQLRGALRELGYALAGHLLSVNSKKLDSVSRYQAVFLCVAADFRAHQRFLDRLAASLRCGQQPILVLCGIELEQLPPLFLFYCFSKYLHWSTPTRTAVSAVPILDQFVSPSHDHPLVSYAREQAAMPLDDLEVTLKQISVDDLNETARLALNFIFEGYNDPKETDRLREVAQDFHERAKNSGITHQFDFSRPRRFAGDNSLAREKYFTVAEDRSGFDRGVLVTELMAYYRPWHSGIVEIFDLSIPAYKQLFDRRYGREIHRRSGLSMPAEDLVGVYFLSSCRTHPFGHLTGDNNPLAFFHLPVRIKTKKIPGVLDLRQPKVADWFANHFSSLVWKRNGREVPVFPNKNPVKNFREILPSLLTQQLGGGGFTKVIGWWLRRHGVQALIFPSARYDSSVRISNGSCVSFSGWNLVDYRGSPMGEVDLRIDISSTWPAQIENSPDELLDALTGSSSIAYEDVEIRYTATGERAGSWEVKGLVSRRLATTEVAKVLSQIDQLGIGDPTKKTLGQWLFAMQPNQARTAHANTMTWALLGVEEAKTDILAWKASAESSGHQDLARAFAELVQKSRVLPAGQLPKTLII
jgi:hypothetical protein